MTGGAAILDDVEAYLTKYVVYSSEHDLVAHVLWIAHTWAMDRWQSTPRIMFTAPQRESGKTRSLEVTKPLVPNAVHAMNASPAFLLRRIADQEMRPTVLFDEVDALFGNKAKVESASDLKAVFNAGHRRGAVAGRCEVHGKTVVPVELPAYCATAFAGLGNLPDTTQSRTVMIRMRRKTKDERVTPWRDRSGEREAAPIAAKLEEFGAAIPELPDGWPVMPEGVDGRHADVWEALLAVAAVAGGGWPERARQACLAHAHVTVFDEAAENLDTALLTDLRDIFGTEDVVHTQAILEKLFDLEESPWKTIDHGQPITSNWLSRRLKRYGIKPAPIQTAGRQLRGYRRDELADVWARYLTEEVDGGLTGKQEARLTGSEAPKRDQVDGLTGLTGYPGYQQAEEVDGLPESQPVNWVSTGCQPEIKERELVKKADLSLSHSRFNPSTRQPEISDLPAVDPDWPLPGSAFEGDS